MDKHLILYGTIGCHLCEEALVVVRRALEQTQGAFEIAEIDIAGDDELESRYGVRIPVLKRADRADALSWPFDLPMVLEYIES